MKNSYEFQEKIFRIVHGELNLEIQPPPWTTQQMGFVIGVLEDFVSNSLKGCAQSEEIADLVDQYRFRSQVARTR